MNTARLGVALLLGSLCACGRGEHADCVIRGVVVDVQDGEPLVGVRVEGPNGSTAVSDRRGRFLLTGLQEGLDGPVRAWRSDGWEAEVPLRPLRPGGVEITLYLSPADPVPSDGLNPKKP